MELGKQLNRCIALWKLGSDFQILSIIASAWLSCQPWHRAERIECRYSKVRRAMYRRTAIRRSAAFSVMAVNGSNCELSGDVQLTGM